MAGSEGAARRRLEAAVSRAAAVVVVVGVVAYVRARAPELPPAASPAVVTGTSPLATGEAHCADRGDAPLAADRSTTVEPGRLDLVGIARWEEPRVEPFPDVQFEVVRAQDDGPVPGAAFVATLWPPRGPIRRDEPVKLAGRADERGRFTIRSAQEYDLAVHASGLGWQTACIDRDRAEARQTLRFELSESVVLDVLVAGPDGAPQPGAQVSAFGIEKTRDFVFHGSCGNPMVEWSTDLGRAGVEGRLPEVECLRGRRIGFFVGNDEGSWLLSPIVLDGAPGTRQSVVLAIPPLVRVVGSVLHADGTPVEGAKLRFERRFDAWGIVDTEFFPGDDGRYVVTLDHPGSYRVELSTSSDEFGWSERETRDVFAPAGETNIDFVDPDPAPALLPPCFEENGDASRSGTVRGRVTCVTGPSDPPVDFAHGHALLLRDGRVDADAQLEEDGTFERKNVGAGEYSLLVVVPGFARSGGGTFTFEPGSELVLPDVRLSPVPPIRGRVVDPDGRPVEGVAVIFEYLPSSSRPGVVNHHWEVDSATTDATGTFEVGDVSGAGRLHVEADGVPPRIVPLSASGARDALVIEVPSTRAISGRIELPGGLPDVKVEVSCVSALSESLRRELDDNSSRFERVATTPVEHDGTFQLSKAPTTAFDLEIWVNTSGWGSIGCVVARRHVPAGAKDVELGAWWLANGAK